MAAVRQTVENGSLPIASLYRRHRSHPFDLPCTGSPGLTKSVKDH